MKELEQRLAEKQIELEMTDEAKEYIATNGFDPVYGARPLKRYIQRHVETKLAKAIIARDIIENQKVQITIENDGIAFQVIE